MWGYDQTIDDMADAGSDMISVDNVVDLEHVKNTAGQKMPILGNVAPVDYFIQGTKEEMDAAVKRCLQKHGIHRMVIFLPLDVIFPVR